MSVTEFAGVTGDKDRGVTSRSGLYEFWTEKNAHIYLHDTDFTCLTYQPGRPPVLWLEFLYDPQWTPPELSRPLSWSSGSRMFASSSGVRTGKVIPA